MFYGNDFLRTTIGNIDEIPIKIGRSVDGMPHLFGCGEAHFPRRHFYDYEYDANLARERAREEAEREKAKIAAERKAKREAKRQAKLAKELEEKRKLELEVERQKKKQEDDQRKAQLEKERRAQAEQQREEKAKRIKEETKKWEEREKKRWMEEEARKKEEAINKQKRVSKKVKPAKEAKLLKSQELENVEPIVASETTCDVEKSSRESYENQKFLNERKAKLKAVRHQEGALKETKIKEIKEKDSDNSTSRMSACPRIKRQVSVSNFLWKRRLR